MALLEPGLRGQATRTVDATLTAEALGSGSLPVFGTPALLALMEQAAVTAIEADLEPGVTSVGVFAELHHSAPTPVGLDVRAEATLIAVEGRVLTFEITAYDEAEQIGRAIHRRVLVDVERFTQRVTDKGRQWLSPEVG